MDDIIAEYLEVQHMLFNAMKMEKSVPSYRQLVSDEEELEEDERVEKEQTGCREIKREKKQTKEIEELKARLNQIVATANSKGIVIPLEKICADYQLNEDEKTILLTLFFSYFGSFRRSGFELMRVIATDLKECVVKMRLLMPDANLMRNRLIVLREGWLFRESGKNLLKSEYTIPDELFLYICSLEKEYKGENESGRLDRIDNFIRGSLLYLKEPEVSFEQLVLAQEIRERIELALWQFQYREQVFREYGMEGKFPYGTATILLFYGAPGTGKTATAEAIARQLGKKIGIVRYNELYDRYVGESEKNIRRIFEQAAAADCVLLFDEADACFGSRMDERDATDRMHNLMTNILMQEMERYKGLMILTTNRNYVLDQAFERRILLRLEFPMPGPAEREKIWRLFLQDCPKLSPDVSFVELATRFPFSGGKIKNSVLKALWRAGRENRDLRMEDLTEAAREELGNDRRYSVGF